MQNGGDKVVERAMMVHVSLIRKKIWSSRFIINLVWKFLALFCRFFFFFFKQQQQYNNYRNESLTHNCLALTEAASPALLMPPREIQHFLLSKMVVWSNSCSSSPSTSSVGVFKFTAQTEAVSLSFYRTFTFAFSTDSTSLKGHIPPNVIILHLKYERYNSSMKIFLPRWRLAPAVA